MRVPFQERMQMALRHPRRLRISLQRQELKKLGFACLRREVWQHLRAYSSQPILR